MKVIASILLLASSLTSLSHASSTIRGLSEASPTPTSFVTTYLPTYHGTLNETDDNQQSLSKEQGLTPKPDGAMSAVDSSTETTAPSESNKGTQEAGLGTAFVETIDEPFRPDKPDRNDTIAAPASFSEGGDSNETASLDYGEDGPPPASFFDHGDSNETASAHDHGPKGPGIEQNAEGNLTDANMDAGGNVENNARGPPAPAGFQELVDDKCTTFDCSTVGNFTCPSPNAPSDRNATEEKGPIGPGKGPKRELKPGAKKPNPEELLACACCEGVTVDEFNSTGVDVSGLAFLVGYDPSAATLSDNSANLNSLVFSSSSALVVTAVLAVFV